MSKASLSTDGGVPIGYKKSEFYTLTSSGKGDYVPIDLEGALEVVLRMDNSEGNIFGYNPSGYQVETNKLCMQMF